MVRISTAWLVDSVLGRFIKSYGATRRWPLALWLACLFAAISFPNLVRAVDTLERLTPESMWRMARIGEVQLSPDGKSVAYVVTRYDIAKNAGTSDLVVISVNDTATPSSANKTVKGFDTPFQETGKPRIVLQGISGLNSIGWLVRSGKQLLVYIAPGEGELTLPQAWAFDLEAGKKQQLTKIKSGIAHLKASPTGKHLAFAVDVPMDPTVKDLYSDLPLADARIIDSLMFRHWNAWHDFAYSHIHVASFQADGTLGTPRDVMLGMRYDCPLPPQGSSDHFNFSPDGEELALTIKRVDDPAQSTDSSIFITPVAGGSLRNVTPDMPGYDTNPVYSPDGRLLAWNSMARAGFEADRNRIMLMDRETGAIREATAGLDQTTHNVRWGADSRTLYFDSEYAGTQQIYRLHVEAARLAQLSSGSHDFQLVGVAPDQSCVIATQQNMLRGSEIARIDISNPKQVLLTDVNSEIFDKLDLPSVDEMWTPATDGARIHSWIVLPPHFDRTKTYPLLVYCQGGPQSQVGQRFSYRWNFHLMAAKGYVVLAVNRRGLPGFGQAWNDQISGDWGGQAMKDILSATDAQLEMPYIDRERVGAIGASFGGYTIYWMMGNAAEKFAVMIAHCGVFNLESMYGSTEELFFPNFDLGGPYWKSSSVRAKYDQFSPHRFIGNWKTPLLIIHGEKDFRVPVTQGIEAFTAAQVQKVPSRFLYFPGEGHHVLSPQNSILWHRVFYDWLDTHLKP